MLKNSVIHTLTLFLMVMFISCKEQHTSTTGEKYIELLNSYDTAALQTLLADSFQLKRSFVNYVNDKNSLINNYVPYSKEIHAKYHIAKVISAGQPEIFLADDESDYLKYLHVKAPQWKISVTSSNNIVQTVLMDKTESSDAFFADMKLKDAKFTEWVRTVYKDSKNEVLTSGKGLSSLLKEYDETVK